MVVDAAGREEALSPGAWYVVTLSTEHWQSADALVADIEKDLMWMIPGKEMINAAGCRPAGQAPKYATQWVAPNLIWGEENKHQ